MKIVYATTFCLLCTLSSLSMSSVLDERQHNQRQRIIQGIHSGELTHAEVHNLKQGQRQLRRMEYRSQADGQLSTKEQARLHRKAQTESKKIFRNKHDHQTR